MNAVLLDEATKVITETPVLINMVSRRVRELSSGSRPMVNFDPHLGLADIALLEIAQGKLSLVPAKADED